MTSGYRKVLLNDIVSFYFADEDCLENLEMREVSATQLTGFAEKV